MFTLADYLLLALAKATLAETEKESAFLRIKELEQQVKSAKESSAELARVKTKLEVVEKEGQAHDEELTGLLVPLADALAGLAT